MNSRSESENPLRRLGDWEDFVEHDRRMLSWVQKFNPYDLYSKSPVRPDWEELRPYYTAVIDQYLPGKLRW